MRVVFVLQSCCKCDTETERCVRVVFLLQKELLRVIRRQRGKAPEGFVRRMQEFASEEEDMFINNHLLLFTSALVPKAISSLLTSFFIGISRPQLVGVLMTMRTGLCTRKHTPSVHIHICPVNVLNRGWCENIIKVGNDTTTQSDDI